MRSVAFLLMLGIMAWHGAIAFAEMDAMLDKRRARGKHKRGR